MGSFASIRKGDHADAWTAFWDEQSPDSRCLQGASPAVRQALSNHWQAFAAKLPLAATVLDIGCGKGAAARSLASARGDIRVVGIDTARVQGSPHPQIEIWGETRAEELPRADASLDAAISQFGFEYSNVPIATKELARVLRPGARMSFVVHHSASVIVRRERAHGEALDELGSARAQRAFLARNIPCLVRIRDSFPDDQTVMFAANCLASRSMGTDDQRRQIWSAVMDALAPDRTLSAALEGSCVAPAAIDDWLEPLREQFRLAQPELLLAAGEVLAWRIVGVRV